VWSRGVSHPKIACWWSLLGRFCLCQRERRLWECLIRLLITSHAKATCKLSRIPVISWRDCQGKTGECVKVSQDSHASLHSASSTAKIIIQVFLLIPSILLLLPVSKSWLFMFLSAPNSTFLCCWFLLQMQFSDKFTKSCWF
jgi:hypothetical protein